MKYIFFIFLLPTLLYGQIGREFVPSSESIGENPFFIYNAEYKSLVLNYNHYGSNNGDMDLTFLYPSEWNGTFGANLFVYNFPSIPVFKNAVPDTNYNYGVNVNYSNIIFNSSIGLAFNVKTSGMFGKLYLSPALAYFISNQYGNYSYLFLSPTYELFGKNIFVYAGYYGLFNDRLSVQSLVNSPVYGTFNDLTIKLETQYRLPLSIVIGGDIKYKNKGFLSSVKTGFSFDYFKIYAGIDFKDFALNGYFIEFTLISRFGGIVKF